jgi:hypothetical protein
MSKYKVFETRTISSESFSEIVKSAVEDWRTYALAILKDLENIPRKEMRLLGYFALIESIAQDVANYPERENQKAFTEFVLKYQTVCSFLKDVDPITLFYRVEHNINQQSSLDNFIDGSVYSPNDKIIRDKAKEIELTLKTVFGEEKSKRYINNHRYIDLLYRLRCKLSHEFSSSHIAMSKDAKEPYYMCCSRYYLKDAKIIQDDVWTFNIPIEFIKSLCENCISNYLDECLQTNRLPLPNNTLNRFCELSWYPKP